ncbi:MAG: PAS domain S-box protein [Nitrospira sp.]|nr:PAS domain S-box protein [Nitrospira sp.]
MSNTGHPSELDLLRGQVADLSRQLAERERSAHDRQERSDLLRAIVEATAAETGEEFFAALVTHLTSTLHMKYAIIGEVQGDRIKKIRTLAVSAGGVLVDNFEYELAHTPCATALTQAFAYFDRDIQAMFPQFQRLVDLGAESYCGVPLRTKSGAVIGLLVVMDTKPLENSDDLQSLLGVFAPRIAAEFERRRAEQERAQALTDLHNVIETIPDVVFALDIQGNLVKWNRRFSDVTGYSPEELLNMPALDFVPPDEQARTAAAIQRAFSEGYAELEGHMLTRDHRLIPYHWTGALLRNVQGEPIGITGIGRDISEKKREEEELYKFQEKLETLILSRTADLKQAQQLLQDVIDSSPDWIFVKDLDHRFLLVNRSFAASQGLRPSDMHGHIDSEFWPLELCEGNPAKGIRGYHADDRTAFQGKLVRNEYDPATLQDGRLRIFDTYKGPMWGADGGVYGVLCYARDMTEQREAEAELQRAHDALEQRVADRTAELEAANLALERTLDERSRDVMELKQTEERLQQSEERYRALYDETPTMYFTLTLDGTVLSVNRFGAEQLGYDAVELVGRSVLLVFHEADKEAAAAKLSECLTMSERTSRWEFRKVRKDGQVMWVRETVRLGRSSTGETILLVSCEDITDLKRVEVAVRESQQRLQAIMEGTSDAVFMKDVQGRYLLFNRAAGCFVGKNPEDVIGRDDTFIFPHDEAQGVMERDRGVMAGGLTLTYEDLVTTADGQYRTFMSTKGPLFGPDGAVIGLFGIARDITERKRAEEAIKAAELRYRAIFEQAGAGVAQIDSHKGRFVQVNRRYCEILGMTEAEILATTFIAITHPDDLQGDLDNMARLWRGEIRSFSMEKRLVRKDGRIIWINLNVAPLWEPGEQATYHIAIVDDITDRKRAEESRHEMNVALANAMPGIARLSSDGRYLEVNEAYAGVLGYDPSELIGSDWARTVHSNYRSKVEAAYATMLQEGKGEIEALAVRKDGSTFWKQILMVKIVNRKGRHLGHHCFMRDITERKELERIQREQQERLALAMEIAELATWDWNIQTNQVTWSENCEQVKRLPPGTFDGTFEAYQRLVHPDDLPELLRQIEQALTQGVPYHTEHRIIPPSGEVQWVEGNGRVYRTETGQPIRMVGTVWNVTESKQAEEALIRSEQQMRTVLDALPVGVWFTDQLGKPLFGNPAAKQIWSDIKQVGMKTPTNQSGWWETIGPVDEMHRWALSRTLTTGVPSLNEALHLEYLDGTKKTIRNSAVPIKDEEGNILGAIVLNEDITMLRQAQEDLKLTQFSVDQAVEAFFWISPEGQILNVNDAACWMLEYTREELTSMTVPDIDPNFPSEAWPVHWEELKQKGSLTFESKHWSKTGRVLDTEVTVNYLQYEGKEYNCAIMRNIAERKRAEEALYQSEERYRSLVNNAPIGIFVNEAGRFVYANREFQRIVDAKSAEQLLGMPVLDRIAPEFHTVVKDRIDQLMEKGQAVPLLDEQYVRLDGSRVDVSITAIPTSLGGTPVMQVLVLDITERKRAEEALKESEQAIRDLHEATAAPGLSFDERVRAVLEVGCRRYKLPIGMLTQVVGEELQLTQVWAPGTDFRAGMAVPLGNSYCNTTLQSTDPVCFEHAGASEWREHPGYNALGLESYIGTKLIGRDQIYGTICFAGQDPLPTSFSQADKDFVRLMARWISGELDRRMAEHALKQSEERYHALYDDTPTMYFTLATDGTVLSVNRFGAEQLGYQVEDLVGHSVLSIFYEKDKEAVAASLSECLATPEIRRQWEFRKVRKDGTIIWVGETVQVGTSLSGETIVLVTCEDITERRQMEEALRKSQAILQSFVEHAPAAVAMLDRDLKYVAVSKRWCQDYRLGEIDVIGLHHYEVFPEIKKNALWQEVHRRSLAGEVVRNNEDRFVRADGTEQWMQWEVRPWTDGFGSIGGIIMSTEDITERKRADLELRERNKRALEMHQALLDIVRFDYGELAFSEGIQAVTEIVAEMLGVERVSLWLLSEDRIEMVCQDLYERSQARHSSGSRLIVANFPHYFHAIEDSLVMAVSDALADPRTRELAEGYLFPLRITSMIEVPIRRQGKLIGVLCCEQVGLSRQWSHEVQGFCASVGEAIARMMEAAERKRMEAALRASEDQFNKAFTEAAIGMGLAAPDGRWLQVNQALCEIIGYSQEELEATTFQAITHPDDRLLDLAYVDQLLMGEIRTYEMEKRYIHKQGHVVWTLLSVSLVRTADGAPAHFVKQIHDITERKRIEGALRQRECELQAALEERERISQDLHDGILQSLFAVGLALESTKLTMSPGSRKTSGASLDPAIRQLNLVMGEIRSFIAGLGSDLLKGKDISAVLHQMLAPLTENQPTRVRLAVEGRAAKALSTEQALHLLRVIQESVSNCIKHGHAREARVSLKLLKQGVRLSIRDNGRGFNPDTAKGAGHGLSNMAARAQKIGGRFSVSSKPNEGTSIVLDLPKVDVNVTR